MQSLLRRLVKAKDTALPLRDDGASITAVILDADGFTELQEPVPIDAERGITGRFGVTEDGREELVELSFDKGQGWNQKQVQSFLARNGIDAADGGRVMTPSQVHMQIGRDAITWHGTTLPSDDDGHSHDFCLETWWNQVDEKWMLHFWTTNHDGSNISHTHEWNGPSETAVEDGHSHALPELPAAVIEALARVGLDVNNATMAPPPGQDRLQRLEVASNDDAWVKGTDAVHMSDLVEETDDWWIIKDSVITRDGVFNGTLRPASMIRDSWMLYEGIPITHGHPPDLVRSLDEVAGIIRNVRLDEVEDGVRVLADMHLAKRPGVDGLSTTQALVDLNAETVTRTRSGQGVDNSQGFLHKFLDESGEFNGREYHGVVQALVPNHDAILLDEVGACPWTDGCGVARLGGDENHGNGQVASERMLGTMGKDCDGKCTDRQTAIDKLTTELDGWQETAKVVLDHAGATVDGDLTPGTFGAALAGLKSDMDALADYRKAEAEAHDNLVEKVVAIAAKDKEGKPLQGEALDKARARYAAMSSDALLELHAVHQAASKPPVQIHDTTRVAADNKSAPIVTPGKPVKGADGRWQFPTKEDQA